MRQKEDQDSPTGQKMMRLIRETASKTTFDITPFKFIHPDRHQDYKSEKFTFDTSLFQIQKKRIYKK